MTHLNSPGAGEPQGLEQLSAAKFSEDLLVAMAFDECDHTSTSIMWLAAPNWQLGYANRQTLTLFGVDSIGEIDLTDSADTSSPTCETDPRVNDLRIACQLVAQNEGVIDDDLLAALPKHLTVRAVRTDHGDVVCVHGPNEPTYRADREAAHTRRLMDQFLDMTPSEIYMKDLDGRYILSNKRMAASMGKSLEEIIGRTSKELLDNQATARRFREAELEVARRLEPIEAQDFAELNGRRQAFWTVLFPVFGDDGQLEATGGVSTEVTQRAEAEEALRASEEQFRQAFDSANDGVLIFDLDGIILRANRQMCAFLERQPEELVGTFFGDYLSIAEDEPTVQERLAMVLAHGSSVHERVWETASGSKVHTQVSSAMLYDADGQPMQMVGHVSDLAERQRAEFRIRQGEKLEAIGQLAGGIAHDINNLLSGILGYADLLALTLEDPEQLERCEQILTTTRRAADFTARLQSFTRAQPKGDAVFDLHDITAEVVSILHRSIDPQVSIETDLAASKSHVLGDPSQMQGALLNLALNARDAILDGGKGSGTIVFRTTHLSSAHSGGSIRVEVIDDGVGLSDDQIERVCEPFYTTKAEGRGTGLGLTSVVAAAHHHHGVLTIASSPTEGSTFTLELPVADTKPTDLRPVLIDPLTTDLTGLTVLTVDDDAAVRFIVSGMLREHGATVLEAVDGTSGIEMLNEHADDVDVLLFDMKMPRADGREMFATVVERWPQILGILMTGFSADHDAGALRSLGVRAVIQKPFDREVLVQHIAKIVAEQRTIDARLLRSKHS